MNGFGYLGLGGPFQSSSNLSPLAPPFTVDSNFPRPALNHSSGQLPENEHYFDPNSYPARPPQDNWLNLNTPGYGNPNSFPNTSPSPTSSPPNPETNPTRAGGYSSASAYGSGMANFFSSQSITRPYHPQYPSASVQGSTATLDVNERGGNMLPTSSLTPTAPGIGYWYGKNGGEQWKGKGEDVIRAPSSSSSYARHVNQGKSADGLSARDEAPRVWVGKSTESLPGDFFAGAEGIYVPPGKQSSASNENSRNIRFDMPRTSVSNTTSHQEKPYQGQSQDFVMEPWSQFNPSAYGGYFPGGDSYRNNPLCFYPNSLKSSVDPTYESPSVSTSATFFSRTGPTNLSPIERPKDAFDRKADSTMRSPSSTKHTAVNAGSSDFYIDTSSMINGVEANDHAVPIKLDLPTSVDPIRHVFKAKSNVQVTDSSSGLPNTLLTAATGSGDSVDCSSEVLEQFNPGVDSPCWKGASDSRYSLFGVVTSDIPEKISEDCNSSSLQVPPNHDNGVAFSSMDAQRNEKCFREDETSSLLEQPFPVANLPSECSAPSNMDHLSAAFSKLNLKPINTSPGGQLPRVDLMVNLMQNFSEMLLSYSSKDMDALKEQDYIAIQQVVLNLGICLSRGRSPKPQFPQSEMSNASEKLINIPEVINTAKEVKKNPNMKGDNSTLLAVSSDDSKLEQDDMTKGIKKILEKNFHDEVEADEQSLLYKNLWLETEAALCAVKYKERFARMKIEMEKSKQQPKKENTIESNGGSDKSEVSHISEQNPNLVSEQNPNLDSSTDNHEGNVDASVLARFHILLSRSSQESEVSNPNLESNQKEKEEEPNSSSTGNHTGDVDDASVLARFQILQARINRTVAPKPSGIEEDIVMKPQNPTFQKYTLAGTKTPLQFIAENSVPYCSENYSGKYQWPFIRENYSVEPREEHDQVEFGAMQSATIVDRFSSGESDSPSPPSDWEHVLKDAVWPA